jgi:chromosome segregation ATPase
VTTENADTATTTGGDATGTTDTTDQAGEADRIAALERDVEKWKGLSRKHEDRAKSNSDAATRLEEIENAQRSDLDKANDKAAKAEERATGAEKTAMQLEVALDKAPEGMAISQIRKLAKRLHGSTRDELEADATELFADFKPDTGDGPEDEGRDGDEGDKPRGRPKENLRTGATGTTSPEETDPTKLAAQVPRM